MGEYRTKNQKNIHYYYTTDVVNVDDDDDDDDDDDQFLVEQKDISGFSLFQHVFVFINIVGGCEI